MWVNFFRTLLAGAAAVFVAAVAHAQQPPPDFSKVEIKTTQIADNFYTLEGLGGTISVLTGPDGVLLVDSQYAALTDKLAAAIKKLSNKPIRFVINTHVHPDHTGGNENFAKLGALVFSRDQLRARLEHPNPAADGTPGKPAPAPALPVVTYDGPVSIHLDGENVRLLPIRSAHTDGDTLVSFTEHDILAVGDYYRGIGYPFVDIKSGGTLQGILDGLGATIGRCGPKTKVIPGHGPVTDRNAAGCTARSDPRRPRQSGGSGRSEQDLGGSHCRQADRRLRRASSARSANRRTIHRLVVCGNQSGPLRRGFSSRSARPIS